MTTAPVPAEIAADHDGNHIRVAVIGAGFGGLAAAVHLMRDGEHDFVILERAHDVGGVWRDNTYPGAACDVPSHLYSLSFAPNPDWGRSFSAQAEILAYQQGVAREFGVLPHVRFGQEVLDASWDETSQNWAIRTSDLELTADVLVDASGPLTEPTIPDIKGLSSFTGEIFHSARWNHDLDLRGRRVAVIGSGASAIQFVPEIQPLVGHLVLAQRTAPWVLPRNDRATTGFERRLYSRVPALQRVARSGQYLSRDLFMWPIMTSPRIRLVVQAAARAHIRRQVSDPALRERLIPDYEVGCKRILISNSWYPALDQPNVEVVSGGVDEIRTGSIVTSDGVEHEVDTIILGTGFHVADAPIAPRLHGRDGRSLAEAWGDHPSAYLATTVTGFPNLFRLGGLGTATGHNSHVFQEEAQLAYVVDALRLIRAQGIASVDVRAEAQAAYTERANTKVKRTVWSVGGCKSWYLDGSGHASVNWPGPTWRFRVATRRFDPINYELRQAVRTTAPRVAA